MGFKIIIENCAELRRIARRAAVVPLVAIRVRVDAAEDDAGAASWQYFPLWLYAPCWRSASGYVPHSTARSVRVTISIRPRPPPAPPSRGTTPPSYGSRSTTSKRSPAGGMPACISAAASPTCASPRALLDAVAPQILAHRRAPSSRSLATTVRTPGTSFVYRIARRPDAESASSTRSPGNGAAAAAVAAAAVAVAVAAAAAAPSSSTSRRPPPPAWRAAPRLRRLDARLIGALGRVSSENCCGASTERSRFGTCGGLATPFCVGSSRGLAF